MKNTIYLVAVLLYFFWACTSSKPVVSSPEQTLSISNDSIQILKKEVKATNDTVRIVNEKLEYEVIIIDPGYSTWLVSRAFPRGYHSQTYMENKNRLYVLEWNNRVLQPQRYNPNLYEMTINYESNIDYGYEVNYLIYNYMIYFQNTYKQKLDGYVPLR